MIRASFYRVDGAYTGFSITGHAGYAEEGSDIICAAVSALSQAIAMGLEQVVGLPIDFAQDDENGELSVSLPKDASDAAQVLIKTLILGLKSIEESYPGFVRVTDKDRRYKHVEDESATVRP